MAEEQRPSPPPGGGWTPVPDPTVRSAEMVEAAKDQLRREMLSAIAALVARLDGMDKALVLLQTIADRIPGQIHERLFQLERLHGEKFATMEVRFNSIAGQFTERDVRVEQTSKDSTKAIDAALSAAKELVSLQNTASTTAIDKSEKATAERINQIMAMIQTSTGALDSKINMLTEQSKNTVDRGYVDQATKTLNDKIEGPTGLANRLQSMDSRGMGRHEQRQENVQSNQWIIGLILGIAGLLVGILIRYVRQ
jgi:hypothetical protein